MNSLIIGTAPTKNTGAPGQIEDPLRANIGPLLLADAGLDDQPAIPWKRLACGQDVDDVDDEDEDLTQTGRRLRLTFFRRCDSTLSLL